MEGAGWGHRHRERGRAEARTLACLPDVLIEKSFRNLSHCNGLLQKFEPFVTVLGQRRWHALLPFGRQDVEHTGAAGSRAADAPVVQADSVGAHGSDLADAASFVITHPSHPRKTGGVCGRGYQCAQIRARAGCGLQI